MKKVVLSGKKTLSEIRHDSMLSFCPLCVQGTSDLAEAIQYFEDKGETRDVFLELNGEILPNIEAADFNHVGILIKAMYRMFVRMGFLNIKTSVKVEDVPYLNTMVYEETQYPRAMVKAANLLTQFEYYEDAIKTGKVKNMILCVPKFKKDDIYINDFLRKRTGKVKYAYGNLLAFILYFELGRWIGSTDEKRGTCSEENAFDMKDICRYFIERKAPEDLLWYKCYDNFDKHYQIAPVHFLLMPEIFNYYLIGE